MCLEAILKISVGLQRYLLALNFFGKRSRGYGHAPFIRLVQAPSLTLSPSKAFLVWLPQKWAFWTLVFLVVFSAKAVHGRSARYRVMWRGNPATTMVIGWDQVTGSNARLYYDTRDYGRNVHQYAFSEPAHHIVEAKAMNNHFVRLRNLQPNTVYYFVVADSDGVSARYSFQTAPDRRDVPLSIVAGGDSRNYRAARRFANRMVSKIRPTFVLFAGDMTGGDSGPEWIEWFDDWQETFGRDGRIFPIVVARGNHESSNQTLLHLFDVGVPEMYYAHNFGGDLLRVYTLNSMIAVSGTQKQWLETDLKKQGNQVLWRIAQYHHAIRPHTTAKVEKNQQLLHWAPLFFTHQVDLVLESDSHVVKWTYPIRPGSGPRSEEGFIRDEENGTVYIGEGCWGAPLRNNDDDKIWTRASAAFNQFKLIFVNQDNIEVRTILTDQAERAPELAEEQRFALPSDFPIWKPETGSVVYLSPRQTQMTRNTSANRSSHTSPDTEDPLARSKKNIREWSQLPRIDFNRAQEIATVPFELRKRGDVLIKVYDVNNTLVGQVGLRNRQAGSQQTRIPLRKLKEGLYLVAVSHQDETLHYYQLLCE